MVRKSSLLIMMGILIALLLISYISITFYEKQRLSRLSFASITPLIRQIMVVDMDQRGLFNAKMVVTQQLPILSIQNTTQFNEPNKIELDFLDHIGRLFAFDIHHSKRIDSMTPIYRRLALVYLNHKKISLVIPIAVAGIRAIYLDERNLTPTELFPNGPKGYWNVVNTAALADGSTRVIRVIPMDANDLPI